MMSDRQRENNASEMKLFQDFDGNPIIFYFRPCKKRSQIQPIIEEHGGKVTVRYNEGYIKLANDTDAVSTDDFISARYIEDCVKAKEMLDMDNYRVKRKANTSKGDDEDTVSDISGEDDPYVTVNTNALKGRRKYTEQEDLKLLKYIMEEGRYKEIQGINLWRDMGVLGITDHSYQSMRSRLLRTILPTLGDYDIPVEWKKKLKQTFPSLVKVPVNIMEKSSPMASSPTKDINSSATDSPDKGEKDRSVPALRSSTLNKDVPSCPGQGNKSSIGEKDRSVPALRSSTLNKDVPSCPGQGNKSSIDPKGKPSPKAGPSKQSSNGQNDTDTEDELDQLLMQQVKPKSNSTSTPCKKPTNNSNASPSPSGQFRKSKKSLMKFSARRSADGRFSKRLVPNIQTENPTTSPPCKNGSTESMEVDSDTQSPSEKTCVSPRKSPAPKKTQTQKSPTHTKAASSNRKGRSAVSRTCMDVNVSLENLDVNIDTEGGDDSISSTDEGNNISEIIRDLCEDFQISEREAFHLLWLNNGDVQETVYFLETGHLQNGKPVWRSSNDKLLNKYVEHGSDSEGDDDAAEFKKYSEMIQTYGKDMIRERVCFLEGI